MKASVSLSSIFLLLYGSIEKLKSNISKSSGCCFKHQLVGNDCNILQILISMTCTYGQLNWALQTWDVIWMISRPLHWGINSREIVINSDCIQDWYQGLFYIFPLQVLWHAGNKNASRAHDHGRLLSGTFYTKLEPHESGLQATCIDFPGDHIITVPNPVPDLQIFGNHSFYLFSGSMSTSDKDWSEADAYNRS